MIEAVRKGDYQAFEILFNNYYPILCKYAKSIVHSKDIAEDLVSNIFVKIWEQPDVLSAKKSLNGYLLRSVHNTCLNYLSRQHRSFQDLNLETIEELESLNPQLTIEDYSGILMANELEEKIEQSVEKLPEECRKIFKMSRGDNLSYHEIAQKLNISENTVKVQICRALAKIRKSLEEFL